MQKTEYEMRIGDWSSDVCSSDLATKRTARAARPVSKPSRAAGTARKTAAKETVARRKPAARPRRITPEQALENTRKLLEAKQEHDRQPPPWQQLDGGHDVGDHGGYQSGEAAAKAAELHAAESRPPAHQGSIGTRGRHDPGKRANRATEQHRKTRGEG